MEALTSSPAKLVSDKYRDGDKSGLLGPRIALNRPEIRSFRPSLKHVKISFSLSTSLPRKKVPPLLSVSSLSSSDSDTQVSFFFSYFVDMVVEGLFGCSASMMKARVCARLRDDAKAVHVKFQLERECSFGQQFHIVGDDPMFGSWDPIEAVPLNWSDGHVWTAELDVPIGKSIKFKFILKDGTDYVLWQPGPDRILQTWETEKTIIVWEDWETAELQNLTEDEPSLKQNDTDQEKLLVAENLTQPEVGHNTKVIGESTTDAQDTAIAEEKSHANQISTMPRAIDAKEDPGTVFGINGRAGSIEDSASTKDEGTYVLVPGLSPLPLPTAPEDGDGANTFRAFNPTQAEETYSSNEGSPLCNPLPLPTAHSNEGSPCDAEEETNTAASIGTEKPKGLDVPEVNA
ncbi:hypothetical protein RJ640_018346 [Escallonia rubra]|uniref:CBM20 domain-containing protein n=1 Tax=Escallonia rubra TaxID=112253 RepID=A0AA88QVR0_9ASTE|nr:hypothetical protein RJ640_018346 [Escallonia rubra]